MAYICKICKKEFKTSQGYRNHIKSLEHKLKPLNDIMNNYTSRQIQFNNEQKNFIEIYSISNEESKNSNLDLLIYSSSNSSNRIIITNNEELVSDINKRNSINEDNYNYMNESSDNYELDSSFKISNESKLLNNAFIDFMNVVDKYNISNKAGDAFLKVFRKYSS
ncbi:18445_t:CDS:1 [Racocetra persica]|uniref:18445_t:CDS:1 n=1 Tax=Racocetra persica TaxID=160502 RepID=A0ACA9RPT5_9GLOM|nr:18445_t:CDS:1 [Racocetra persica]